MHEYTKEFPDAKNISRFVEGAKGQSEGQSESESESECLPTGAHGLSRQVGENESKNFVLNNYLKEDE